MKEEYLDELVLRELKEKLKRVLDTEELKLKRAGGGKAAEVDGVHALESALESAKKAKQLKDTRLRYMCVCPERMSARSQVNLLRTRWSS